VRRWKVVETPLGPRRQSDVWKTPVGRADVLVLELADAGIDSLDVTAVPAGATLSEVEQFHRTASVDFAETARGTRSFEIELQPLLQGTWRDSQTPVRAHFEIQIPAELPVDAVRRVEVRADDAKYQQPGAPIIGGPPGWLRPSFYLRSGVSWVLPVTASSGPRTLVFNLYAPAGAPTVAVRLGGRPLTSTQLSASSSTWSRHELELPPGAEGALRFEAAGAGVVLIGDPTIWDAAAEQPPPDVIVYMVDTLLASRIGALGSEVPNVSPNMDSLVNRGLTFVRATSTSAWTKPAIASLMTAVHPLTHRIGTRNYTDRLPERAPVLQERFREAGFRTISASASPLGSTLSGLERGFDLAHPPARWESELGPLGHPESRQIQAALLDFIDEDPSRPVFAYLHTLEVHEYGRPMFEEGAPNETPYDRALRYQDAALGELLDALEKRGRETVLVLVSDHGESFGEYGIESGHGYSLRQNQLHVPLVFHGPDWLPRGRVVAPASLVDVAPTLLELFMLPALPHTQGRSLLPGRAEAPPAVYAERTWFLWDHEGPPLVSRLAADGRKLVSGHPSPLSWSLADNPCEDAASAVPTEEQAMLDLERFEQQQSDASARWAAEYGESAPEQLHPADVARLRALGYLQ
jgi:hypothetical protein